MTQEQKDRLEELHRAMEYIVEMKSQEAYFTALEKNYTQTLQELKDYLSWKTT
jgi:hypothetical protein